jgi:hypothetical protein
MIRSPYMGVLEHVTKLADARLVLALLLLGRVVAAVLLEVALFSSCLDARGDLRAQGALALLELSAQAVESLLRQPHLGGGLVHVILLMKRAQVSGGG